MSVKPILFNTEMTIAVMEGKKTATRRLLKVKLKDGEGGWQVVTTKDGTFLRVEKTDENGSAFFPDGKERLVNPPYEAGDILYVRETWRALEAGYPPRHSIIEYKAGGIQKFDDIVAVPTEKSEWKPSIFMPKEAARTFLRVTSVRAERLRSMTVEDAENEGVQVLPPPVCRSEKIVYPKDFGKWDEDRKQDWCKSLARAEYIGWTKYADDVFSQFEKIWNATIKKEELDLCGWEADPFVWVIEFEKISKEEAIK